MVNQPSIRPYFWGGGRLGVGSWTSHDLREFFGYLDEHLTSQRSSYPFSHTHGSGKLPTNLKETHQGPSFH